MDWMEMVNKIFEICIIPLLGILSFYLVQWIKLKGSQIIEETDNEIQKKYLTMLNKTITQCVIATNQTYVEALKAQGKFDLAAQKTAFAMTYNAVLALLTDEAENYLLEAVGDLKKYITLQIEAEVNKNKE